MDLLTKITTSPLYIQAQQFLTSVESKLETTQQKINNHISPENLYTISRIALSIILVPLHPNVFFMGIVVGFVFTDKVKQIATEVNNVYLSMVTVWHRALFVVIGGTICVLAMPISLITITFYHSAQWGADLHEGSNRRLRERALLPVPPN